MTEPEQQKVTDASCHAVTMDTDDRAALVTDEKLRRWLQAGIEMTTEHPDCAALRAHVAARQRLGADWDMPQHLAECPVCLSAFEVLMEQPAAPSAAARARFVSLFGDGTRRRVLWFKKPATGWLMKAALFALIAGGAAWLFTNANPRVDPPGKLVQGRAMRVEKQSVPASADAIVYSTWVETSAPAIVRLRDGTSLEIDAATRYSIATDQAGGTVVTIASGRITFDVVPQPPLGSFKVRTSMGGVDVVGTRFSVDCRPEAVTAFENIGGGQIPQARQVEITSVVVIVSSGTVRVFNKQEEVMLKAGHTATLRNNTPFIEEMGDSHAR